MKRTFLLGLGCQKGGSTWLHKYLVAHPQVRTGFSKEYHVLSVHYLESFAGTLEKRIGRVEDRIANLKPGKALEAQKAELTQRVDAFRRSAAMVTDLDRYVGYFRNAGPDDDGQKLVYDISPDYALLRRADWADVAHRLTRAGLEARLVFIMRDPIERLFSAYRMERRNAAASGALPAQAGVLRRVSRAFGGAAAARAPEPAIESLIAFADRGMNIERSQYEATMQAIEAAFPPDAVHYILFENLFQDATFAELTEFLGIGFVEPNYDRRPKNAAQQDGSRPDPEEVAILRARLDPTYRLAAARFGVPTIKALWRNY